MSNYSCYFSKYLYFQLSCVQKSGGKTDVVQLGGALIEWTTEKSSRKNVFQVPNKHEAVTLYTEPGLKFLLCQNELFIFICSQQITTNTGSEYLLQVENHSTASKWHDAIKRAIDSSVRTHFLFTWLLLLEMFIVNWDMKILDTGRTLSSDCYRSKNLLWLVVTLSVFRLKQTEVFPCGGQTAQSTCPDTAPYLDMAQPPPTPSSVTQPTDAPSVSGYYLWIHCKAFPSAA